MVKHKLLSAGLVLVAVVALSVGVVLSQDVDSENNTDQTGQGLEISPTNIVETADPGESIEIEISLRNIAGIDVIAEGEVNDFVAQDETGQPQILLDDNDEPSTFPLAEYISEIPRVQIAPTEQETVPITINVPEDASPGAHMGVVRFTATPTEEDAATGVTLSASVGTLVMLRVTGDVIEELSIEELGVAQNEEIGGWFQRGPFTFVTRLQNTGNVFLQPTGTLTLKNIFGQEVETFNFNETERNVLPASIRRFEQEFDKDFWFGRYSLSADLQYGVDGSQVSETVSFWVIPWTIIAIVIAIIAVIVIFTRRALKIYKRKILAQANTANTSSYTPPQQ